MEQINKALLADILNPLIGSGDIDDFFEPYGDFDPYDKDDVKRIIEREIVPYYHSQNENYRTAAKRTLSYYLTFPTVDYDRILGSNLIPLGGEGGDAEVFFIWVWECLFATEDHTFSNDNNDYEEIDDYEAAIILKRPDLKSYFEEKRKGG